MKIETHFQEITSRIQFAIEDSTDSIQVAVAWITNEILLKSLCAQALKGVKVEIIMIDDSINNSTKGFDLNLLIRSGVNLHLAPLPNIMHNKFCIVDRKTVITGSFNWTRTAEVYNKENIVVIEGYANVTETYIQEFEFLKLFYPSVTNVVAKEFNKDSLIYSLVENIKDEAEYISRLNDRKQSSRGIINEDSQHHSSSKEYEILRIGYSQSMSRFFIELSDNNLRTYELWLSEETILAKLRDVRFVDDDEINQQIIEHQIEENIKYLKLPKDQRPPVVLDSGKRGNWPRANHVIIEGGSINENVGKKYINNPKTMNFLYRTQWPHVLREDGKEYTDFSQDQW